MHGRPRQQTRSRRSQGLDWVHDRLTNSLDYIPDDELQLEVNDWLSEVEQLPETDVLDYIEAQLSQLRQRDGDDEVGQFDMYRSGDDGEKEFPKSCQNCPHYPIACPVFTRNVERDRRERMQADLADADPTQVKNEYRQFAEDNDCFQIPRIIKEYDNQQAELLVEGRDLWARTNVNVGSTDEKTEAKRVADEATGGTAQ